MHFPRRAFLRNGRDASALHFQHTLQAANPLVPDTFFITHRVVRARQLESPTKWFAPGLPHPTDIPAGAWEIETLDGQARWMVAERLFPGKYKPLRRYRRKAHLYLNIERLHFEVPEGTHIQTVEGFQRMGDGDVVAVGGAGDRWPVPSHRIGGTYLPDTSGNRLRLMLSGQRLLSFLPFTYLR